MFQVVLRAGQIKLAELPAPTPAAGRVLVGSAASVISSGTERTAITSGGGGSPLPLRVLRNPELASKAIEHIREHGLRDTLELARGTTAQDIALGYSCAGVVLDTGGASDLRVEQRVACAGAGYASHAEVVSVPANLVASVPDNVSLRDAAFTTLGAIALQGVRRAAPSLGERVVVVGLGLLGLITIQLLLADGAQVAGIEPDERRRELGAELGAKLVAAPDDAATAIDAWSGRFGADAVVITASAASSAIVNDAAGLLRRKGRIVIVGDVGLDFERGPIYTREADVLISTSYGPGRYDSSYEEDGIDYPISYVRWTENRNMDEFLRLLGNGDVRVDPLVGLELPVDRASEAYAAINSPTPPLAAVLRYNCDRALAIAPPRREVMQDTAVKVRGSGELHVALIGAGGFATSVHLPNLRADPRVRVKTVVTRSATTASHASRLAGGATPATDWRMPLADPAIDLVVIGTRHDSHAEIAAAALEAGKAVLVEKPLGLTRAEIDAVWQASRRNERLAIGFNRPFAPLATRLYAEAGVGEGPVHVIYRVSAPLPLEHWLNDPVAGGGRLLGEACHMFDFTNWLCGVPERVLAAALPAPAALRTVESASVTIAYAGGSLATVHYSGVGAKTLPKERIEVLRGGQAWVLDDFRTLTAYDPTHERTVQGRRADKGHAKLMEGVLAACRGEGPFTPGIDAAYAAQSTAFAARESIATGAGVVVASPSPAVA
jgi:predicted dehydrogenase/threonine dehydrogenase-like Zn-dependent dehydrogenase